MISAPLLNQVTCGRHHSPFRQIPSEPKPPFKLDSLPLFSYQWPQAGSGATFRGFSRTRASGQTHQHRADEHERHPDEAFRQTICKL